MEDVEEAEEVVGAEELDSAVAREAAPAATAKDVNFILFVQTSGFLLV